MKKFLSTIIVILTLFSGANFASAQSLANTLKGKILLQVDHRGEAWYVHPVSGERYYLKDGEAAYEIMRKKSLGISNADLAKIPTSKNQHGNQVLVNRLKGYILLAVEEHGEAWYVNPNDGIRYYLKNGEAAYNIMRNFGLGITTNNLRQIPINNEQIVFDYTFDQVAHITLNSNNFSKQYYADKILPLASLTKLMTALVLLDLNIDWQKKVLVTEEDLNYPKQYVDPGDITSEIDLRAEEWVLMEDLWSAMLIASSNQSAGLLAKHSGITTKEFVSRMNQKAKNLGLTKTIFTEPSGLDPFNIGTAREMALIAKAAFDQPKITQSTIINDLVITVINNTGKKRDISVANRNYSLMKFGVEAAKTGFLYEAQRNVVLKKNNKIIVVLHARSMTERNNIIEKLIN